MQFTCSYQIALARDSYFATSSPGGEAVLWEKHMSRRLPIPCAPFASVLLWISMYDADIFIDSI